MERGLSVDVLDMNLLSAEALLAREAVGANLQRIERALRTGERDGAPGALTAGPDRIATLLQLAHARKSPGGLRSQKPAAEAYLQLLFAMELGDRPLQFPPEGDDLKRLLSGGVECPVLDGLIDAILLPRVARDAYRMIGFSLSVNSQWAPAILATLKLKKRGVGSFCVAGGSAVNSLDEAARADYFARLPLDGFVSHSGEEPLLALAECLKEGRPLGSVPALIHRQDGRVVRNAAASPPRALDARGPMDFDHVFDRSDPRGDRIPVLYAEGCYWGKCTFCIYPTLWSEGSRFSVRTPDNFLDEVRELYERHKHPYFRFVGDALPPAFGRRIAEGLIAQGLKLDWWAYLKIDRKWDKESLRLLAESGCAEAYIGVESLSDRPLALMRKGYNSATAVSMIRHAAEAGIRVVMGVIPDFPTTTYAEAEETFQKMSRLKKYIERLLIFPFNFNQRTPIGLDPAKFGFKAGSPPEFLSHYGLAASLADDWEANREEIYAAFGPSRMSRSLIDRRIIDTRGMSLKEREMTFAKYAVLGASILQRARRGKTPAAAGAALR